MTASDPNSEIRLLVTGATGFIGSRLALDAHRLGLNILATGRAEMEAEKVRLDELRAANVPVIAGMLQDRGFVKRAVIGRTAVIHLAAAQHESAMPDAYFRSVNIDAVRILLEACREHAVQRFVYGSTIGVYGTAPDGVLDEDTPPCPENIYTRTKLEAETLVRSCADDFATTIIRIGETYGPGDQRLLKLYQAIDRKRFFMIGSGENRRQCIHVHDLVRGLLLAVRRPAAVGQIFVLAGRQSMTTNEMVRVIAAALDRKTPHVRAPLWPFLIAARLMETVLPPLRIQPLLHSRRLDFFRKSFTFSTRKAQTLLGFEPEIDFRAGAADSVQWYRDRGLLSLRTGDGLVHTASV